jgi:hypothetical protein
VTGKTHIYEFSEKLSGPIVPDKCGQKLVAGWLQLYFKKLDPPVPEYPPKNYPKDLPPPPR